ncbi:MAG: NADH-quinone oxidoreductase subunit M [Planctomycetota bacterium]
MADITWMTFFPLLTAAVVLLIPSSQRGLIKSISLLGGLITLVLSIGVFRGYIDNAPNPAVADTDGTPAGVLYDKQIALLTASGGPALGADFDTGDGGIARWRDKYLPKDGQEFDYDAVRAEVATVSNKLAEVWDQCVELEYARHAPVAQHIAYVEFVPWIPAFGVNYFVGVDGLSMPLILLTTLLCFICFAYSWNVDKGTKGFYILFLLLETGIIGVFCALDFFLFYVFWEVVLLPMYFLIGIWGGTNRLYAAIKFFIYTLAGSVLMLICMLVMYFNSEPNTFNVLALMELVPAFGENFQLWLFAGMFVGFAIKVPVFPFHTWLPDAHVEAPTPVSMILAGVLLKMGGYGFFRFSYPMLPDAAVNEYVISSLAILGMVNIVYGAFCALAQKDFKKLVAYSSVSHMGYVLLGLAAVSYYGITGSALQMLNHGVSSAMCFLLVGVIYDRAHHRDLERFGGMGLQMPWYTGLAIIGMFASLGLPGLNGFISEFMCFFGAWDTTPGTGSLITATEANGGIESKWIVIASLLGIVLTAAYILWTIQRVYLGQVRNEEYKKFPDVSFREVFGLAPLAFLCIYLGVYPKFILEYMDPSLQALTDAVRAAVGR